MRRRVPNALQNLRAHGFGIDAWLEVHAEHVHGIVLIAADENRAVEVNRAELVGVVANDSDHGQAKHAGRRVEFDDVAL